MPEAAEKAKYDILVRTMLKAWFVFLKKMARLQGDKETSWVVFRSRLNLSMEYLEPLSNS